MYLSAVCWSILAYTKPKACCIVEKECTNQRRIKIISTKIIVCKWQTKSSGDKFMLFAIQKMKIRIKRKVKHTTFCINVWVYIYSSLFSIGCSQTMNNFDCCTTIWTHQSNLLFMSVTISKDQKKTMTVYLLLLFRSLE